MGDHVKMLRPSYRRWRQRPLRLRWWRELALVAVFDAVYEWTSDLSGTDRALAQRHAYEEIRLERALGLFREPGIQAWALHSRVFIEASDLFYATAHFLLPVLALVWLFRLHPERYLRWRDALAWTTGLALVGFTVFPLMPPRMLPARFGIIDTMNVIGGPGSWDTVLLKEAGNQLAAMPSLHISWALWSVLALMPVVRRPWAKLLLALDPLATVVVILVTGNHYILDIVGGLVVLALGYGLAVLSPLYLRRTLVTGPDGGRPADGTADPPGAGPGSGSPGTGSPPAAEPDGRAPDPLPHQRAGVSSP
jgi:hypothetical protein